MFSFSLNPTLEDLERACLVVAQKRPVSDVGWDWMGEAFIRAIKGKIRGSFHPDAYGYACERYYKNAFNKKETFLISEEEHDKGFCGVSESKIHDEIDMEELIVRLDYERVVIDFEKMNDRLVLEAGVNMKKLIKFALRTGNVNAVRQIKGLIEKYELQELIYSVLSNKAVMEALGLYE